MSSVRVRDHRDRQTRYTDCVGSVGVDERRYPGSHVRPRQSLDIDAVRRCGGDELVEAVVCRVIMFRPGLSPLIASESA